MISHDEALDICEMLAEYCVEQGATNLVMSFTNAKLFLLTDPILIAKFNAIVDHESKAADKPSIRKVLDDDGRVESASCVHCRHHHQTGAACCWCGEKCRPENN